jgi:Tat protein secretion system quality control protein TatD with DNase activity
MFMFNLFMHFKYATSEPGHLGLDTSLHGEQFQDVLGRKMSKSQESIQLDWFSLLNELNQELTIMLVLHCRRLLGHTLSIIQRRKQNNLSLLVFVERVT